MDFELHVFLEFLKHSVVWRPQKWDYEFRDPSWTTLCVKVWDFKVPQDILALLSAFTSFINVKFIQCCILLTNTSVLFYSLLKKLRGKSQCCTSWKNPNYSRQSLVSLGFMETLMTTGSRGTMVVCLAKHLGWHLPIQGTEGRGVVSAIWIAQLRFNLYIL